MVNEDEEALMCDLAEVYHIYNMRELSPIKVAVFSCGLRNDSRIKMKLAGLKLDLNTLLLTVCADSLQFMSWCQTDNARKNINRPQSLLSILTNDDKDSGVVRFATGEDFEKYRQEVIERINNVNNSNSLRSGPSVNEGDKK